MKRLIILTCAVLAVVAGPALAAAQVPHSENSRKVDFHLSQPIAVGTTTLKAGDYKVQCKMIDGQHFLVVTSAGDGSEVARVPCTPEALSAKTAITEFRSVPRPDGTSALSAVRIKGETIAHRIVNP